MTGHITWYSEHSCCGAVVLTVNLLPVHIICISSVLRSLRNPGSSILVVARLGLGAG